MLKAIETRYKGYRFRSRLEARFAVFFDALGVQWEYEKEGYSLPNVGAYLPDFWLPDVYDRHGVAGLWCEIKGQEPSARENECCAALCRATGSSVVMCVGLPNEREAYQWNRFEAHDAVWDNGQSWHLCVCGAVKMEFENSYYTCFKCGNKTCVPTSIDLMRASAASRAARFEHGENGHVR